MQRILAPLAMFFLASSLPALPQTVDAAMRLLQRVAAQNGGTTSVLVGKLPADLPPVPLPSASLVGSVTRTTERLADSSTTYDFFYDASTAAAKNYTAALRAAGWVGRSMGGGGFVPSNGAGFKAYCKAKAPFITIWSGEDPTDMRVSVSALPEGASAMCAKEMGAPSPLPELHAPPGVTMSLAGGDYSFDRGRSTALIRNGPAADALLENFAGQMTAAGWRADRKAHAPGIASQSFSKADGNSGQWQCVITIDAREGSSGDFLAFIDAERI